MRRFAIIALLGVLSGGLVLAGCSSSASSQAAASSSGPAPVAGMGANDKVTVTGAFGQAPQVTIPAADPGTTLITKTLISGTGQAITSSDYFVTNFMVYTWNGTSHKLAEDSFTSSPQLFTSSLVPGLQKAIIGQKAGSRVLAVVPPADGFGSSGNAQVGIGPNTTLVYVLDLIGKVPANAAVSGKQTQAGAGLPTVSDATTAQPAVTIPKADPPSGLVSKTLIQGAGPVITSGRYLVVQYTGVNWRTGQVFDSSWSRKQPTGVLIGQPNGVIVGWDLGLEGHTVGSRVLLVIPPKDGYGSKGVASAGIKGTDTLVFVVDILAAF